MTAKKWRICRICGKDERGGGAWVDKTNPMYTSSKIWYAKVAPKEAHGICMILERKRGGMKND